MLKPLLIITTIFLFILPLQAFNGDHENVEEISTLHYWWGVADVEISGSYIYLVTEGTGLSVIDISDPEQPEEIGFFGTPRWALDVSIVGNYAYLVDYYHGLMVLDISDPSNIYQVGDRLYFSECARIYASNNYLIIDEGTDGYESRLGFINISDPENIQYETWYEFDGLIRDIAFVGDYLYMINEELNVYDFTDPLNMVEVRSIDLNAHFNGMEISGDYAYIKSNDDGFRIFDISHNDNPVEVGSYYAEYRVTAFCISGNRAHLVSDNSLITLDISDPFNPVVLDQTGNLGLGFSPVVNNNVAYFISHNVGLQVFDISDDIPVHITNYDRFAHFQDMSVSGDFAYLTDIEAGIRIIDISDPLLPTEISTYTTEVEITTIDVADNYAYVIYNENSLQILDVSNFENIEQVCYLSVGENTKDVSVSGDYAYLANRDLIILDISSPSNPVEVGRYSPPFLINDIEISNNTAYLGKDTGGIYIIDISDPYNPNYVDSYDTGVQTHQISISGCIACLLNDDEEIDIVDIANYDSPTLVGQYDPSAIVNGITLSGNFLYLSLEKMGIRILDLSLPAEPIESGFYDTWGRAQNVVVLDDYIYLNDRNYFTVFDCSQVGVTNEIYSEIPSEFAITSAYPNPFNPTLNVSISMPQISKLKVSVYNIMGQSVATLSNGGQYSAGIHNFVFSANEVTSRSSGVYFIHATVPGKMSQIQKVVLMK
jgi:hypothetical protein